MYKHILKRKGVKKLLNILEEVLDMVSLDIMKLKKITTVLKIVLGTKKWNFNTLTFLILILGGNCIS